MTSKKSMAMSSVVFEVNCPVQSNCREGMEESRKKMCEEMECKLVSYDSLPDYLKDNEFILDYYRCEWPLKQTVLSIFSIHNETLNVWTHLIGFLIFLALAVFTAVMISSDGSPLILHSLSSTCLASPLSGEELMNSAHSAKDVLPPLSGWKLPQILMNCLPEKFHHEGNHTHLCILTSVKDDVTNMISPLILKQITRWPFFTFLSGAMFCLLISSICHLCEPIIKARSSYAQSSLLEFVSIIVGFDGIILVKFVEVVI